MRNGWIRGFLAALGVGLILAGTSGVADAASIGLGTRWRFLSLTATSTPAATVPETVTPGTPVMGFSTNMPSALGILTVAPKVHVLVGVDLQQGKVGLKNGDTALDTSFQTFGIAAGLRYHIAEPMVGAAGAFLQATGFAYFGTVSDESGDVDDEQAQFAADLASPLGFDVALGAEYAFSSNFALGAEVLGVRFQTASASFEELERTDSSFTIYSALTLSFYSLFGKAPMSTAAPAGEFGGYGEGGAGAGEETPGGGAGAGWPGTQ